MAIYLGSRYDSSVVDFIATSTPENVAPVVFYTMPDIGLIEYSTYVWKQGDRLDNLSMGTYGHPEKWWVILAYNPEIIDPYNIPAGTKLRIPNV